MALDKEAVKNLAKLASLSISEDEAGNMLAQLEKSIEFIGKLDSLNAKDVPPMIIPFDASVAGATREDIVRESPADLRSILALAPESAESCIVVPRIIE